MTPDIGTRLATISMALRQVVIPALPPNEVLAIEQATLCVGHLGVLSEQYNYLADYETLCLAEMAGLGQSLVEAGEQGAVALVVGGGPRGVDGCARVEEVVGAGGEGAGDDDGGVDAEAQYFGGVADARASMAAFAAK